MSHPFIRDAAIIHRARSSDRLPALSTDARTVFAGARSGEWTKESAHRRSRLITGELQPLSGRGAAELDRARPTALHSRSAAWSNFNSPHLRRASSPSSLFPRTVTESYALDSPLVSHILLHKLINSTLYDLFFLILFLLILYLEIIFIIEETSLSDICNLQNL